MTEDGEAGGSSGRIATLLLNATGDDLATILDLIAAPAFVVDPAGDGFMFRANNIAHAHATGLSFREKAGQRMDEFLPDDIAAQVCRNYATCVAERVPLTYEECLDLPAGRRWWRTTLIPLIGPDGMVRRVIGTGNDITVVHQLSERAHALVVEQEALRRRLTRTLKTAVDALVTAMETRDPYTAGHQRQVAELSEAIAAAFGLDDETREMIRLGAVLHDIGKLGVPTELLVKPGRLRQEEYALIRAHARVGIEMMDGIDLPEIVRNIVTDHHERLDGSGYPRGLTARQIALPVRIVMVADVIDAMLTDRPYRRHLDLAAVTEEFSRHGGKAYDQEVAAVALSLIRGDLPGFSLPETWHMHRAPRLL
ncbi:HD-GYP domain-containing protein [Tistrella mobilis]